jgi:hypothetical protein
MRKITNLFFLFLLVFIGFFSGRFAVSTHIDSDVTKPQTRRLRYPARASQFKDKSQPHKPTFFSVEGASIQPSGTAL